MTYTAGSHILDKSDKVKKPGSRGGHGYYDEHGEWQYGIRPFPEEKPYEHEDIIRWGVSAYHHLGMTAIPHITDLDIGPLRAEWERRYGEDYYMPNMTLREGVVSAHRSSKAGHDDMGHYTSESLRENKKAIQDLGYGLVDNTTKLAGKPREETWSAVREHCEDLQRLLPGLRDFLKKHPLNIRVMQATKLGKQSTMAQYNPNGRVPVVEISPKYHDSFFHEMGHYLDNQRAGGGRTIFASEFRNDPLAELVRDITSTDHAQDYFKFLAENGNNMAYRKQGKEVLARFFDTWVGHKLYNSERMEFPKSILEEYGPRLEDILKEDGLLKSLLRDWAAGSHLWKSVVQHPGSRGGKGYYTDRGEWVYGERPQPVLSAVQSPGHAPVATPDYDDDDPFGGYDPSADASNYAEPTEADRVAYEQETERELRGIKRHDDAEIRRFIMKRGIRRSDKDQNGKQYFNAEYNDYVPVWARNQSNGITLDRMRRELDEQYPYLGLDTLDDLLGFLEHFEDTRTKKSWHAGSHTDWDSDLAKAVPCWTAGSHAH